MCLKSLDTADLFEDKTKPPRSEDSWPKKGQSHQTQESNAHIAELGLLKITH
jgi:hypothetical protein